MAAQRRRTAALTLAMCSALVMGVDVNPSDKELEAPPAIHAEAWPAGEGPDLREPEVERKVAELLESMTLEEKVGQIIQADIASIRPDDLLTYRLGAILNGANSAPGGDNHAHASEYLALADAFYDASVDTAGGAAAIPVIWGTDAVHGHSNIVGATIFPHNIALGAARDPELIRQIGEATAREVRVTGMDWTFAPTVAVARDDRWGRTYESYSEDPGLVAAYAGQMVEGLQGAPGSAGFLGEERVIATAKHFLGDGGTAGGVDQGDNRATQAELRDVHAAGYPPAIRAGVQTVMASFNSWHGAKLHGHRALLTDVLVGRLGFDGFVVGDWNGHGQVEGCSNESCPAAFRAGLDMAMAPDSWKSLFHNTLADVRSGGISPERLHQAVARVLRVKLRYRIFERGRPSSRPLAGDYEVLGAPGHRALARRAVRQSLVLLKNNGNVLPLHPRSRILVTGPGADDIGMQSGGWTLTWQGEGNTNRDFPNGQSILEGLREAAAAGGGEVVHAWDGHAAAAPDAAVVVFGELPYAEFQGDRTHLDFDDEGTLDTLRRLRSQNVPVVAVFLSGRPLYVTPEINASDAFVAAWLPGTEGGGLADVLVAGADGAPRHDFRGKLSFSWPRHPHQTPLNRGDADYDPLFPYGYGMTYADSRDLPPLVEAAAADCRADTGELVRAGRARPPYRMVLIGEDGAETEVRGASAATTDGHVRVRSVDHRAQEDARHITWRGRGRFVIRGGPADLSREASARMVLTFTYAVVRPPSVSIRAGVQCADCESLADITEHLSSVTPGQAWRRLELPLMEVAGAPEAMSSVELPFVLESDGPLELRLADVRIAMPERRSDCGG